VSQKSGQKTEASEQVNEKIYILYM